MLDRWLTKLERKYSRYVLGNLTYPLVGMMGVVFILALANPGIIHAIDLNRDAVLHGEVWRLVTFLFVPPSLSPLWILFELAFLFQMGSMLESRWGAFKYQAYWFLGWIFTLIAGLALNLNPSNTYLLSSVFLAFATLYPEYQLMLLFIIPVRVKWLGWLAALGLVSQVGLGAGLARFFPLIVMAHYLLFFGPTLVDMLRDFSKRGRNAQKQKLTREASVAVESSARACAICGASESDPAVDIRVCTCAKCGKPTIYCLDHARNH
ncbi:MAG: hypothetical protein Q8Q09_29380 [Deltaproteobacteria bacterium]|nr:hypothetical protein [Deltaproteobacteria bacterium]